MRILMITTLLIASILLLGCAGPGCAAHECGPDCTMHNHDKKHDKSNEHVCDETCDHHQKETGATVGSDALATDAEAASVACIVSGELVEKSSETLQAEHDGVTYYFCCADCQKAFEEDPEKYTDS